MNAIQKLRAAVDLPAGYDPRASKADRKKALADALFEYRLRNSMAKGIKVPKKKPPTSVVRKRRTTSEGDSRRVKILKEIVDRGPITSTEVNEKFGLDMKDISSNVSVFVKRGHIKKTGETRSLGFRHYPLYVATDAGVVYCEQ